MNLDAPRPRFAGTDLVAILRGTGTSVFFHFLAFQKLCPARGWLGQISSIGYVGSQFFSSCSRDSSFVYTYAGPRHHGPQFLACPLRSHLSSLSPSPYYSPGPFFLLCCIDAERTLLRLVFHTPEISGAAGAISTCKRGVPLAALAWNSVAWSLSDEAFFLSAFFPFSEKARPENQLARVGWSRAGLLGGSLAMSWNLLCCAIRIICRSLTPTY